MWSRTPKRLIAFLALISFARADYYIDDQNYTSLLYAENMGGHNWGAFQEGGETLFIHLSNGTTFTIDASYCYNYTYSFAPCLVDTNCRVQIPFDGSGITIYVLQAGFVGINASLTIDGGSPTYNALPAPPGPDFYIPNVTLFSVQGMITGSHTATMTVVNWDNTSGGMMFDYALINQTVVSPMTNSTSSVVSSTALPTGTTLTTMSTGSPMSAVTSSSSTVNISAIVGGVIGILIALVVLLSAIFYLRRRHRKYHGFGAKDEQRIDPFVSTELPYPRTSRRYTSVVERQTSESQATSSSSSRRWKLQEGATNQRTSQVAGRSVSPLMRSSSSSRSETLRTRVQQTDPLLTDDQADLVTRLHANNVPARAIACVIERMMAGEQPPTTNESDSLPPPSYYHGTGGE